MTLGFLLVVLGVVLLLRSLGLLEDVSGETIGAVSVIGVGLWLMYMRLTWKRRWRARTARIRLRRERGGDGEHFVA
jgi:hypothetical protein